MKVLFNLNRADDVAPQMQFVTIRATKENDPHDHVGVIEIVVNEYCGAIYLNLHSIFSQIMGIEFCSNPDWYRRPRLMMEENAELDVSLLKFSYEVFEEPLEDDPDYDEEENYPDEEEDR